MFQTDKRYCTIRRANVRAETGTNMHNPGTGLIDFFLFRRGRQQIFKKTNKTIKDSTF